MVDCPFILKKSKEGISITELLIVIAVLAVLMIVFLAAFKPWTQQAKARDSRRKSDLQKLKNPLEDYYNDRNCYPESLQDLVDGDYIGEEPKDPDTGDHYEYYRLEDDCDKYWIYATLEFTADSEIIEVGCGAGCGPEGDEGTGEDKCAYNYGVCGGGVSLEGCTEKCSGWVSDTCPLISEEDLRTSYCLDPGPGCCPGSGYILTCPPTGRPYCCPI